MALESDVEIHFMYIFLFWNTKKLLIPYYQFLETLQQQFMKTLGTSNKLRAISPGPWFLSLFRSRPQGPAAMFLYGVTQLLEWECMFFD